LQQRLLTTEHTLVQEAVARAAADKEILDSTKELLAASENTLAHQIKREREWSTKIVQGKLDDLSGHVGSEMSAMQEAIKTAQEAITKGEKERTSLESATNSQLKTLGKMVTDVEVQLSTQAGKVDKKIEEAAAEIKKNVKETAMILVKEEVAKSQGVTEELVAELAEKVQSIKKKAKADRVVQSDMAVQAAVAKEQIRELTEGMKGAAKAEEMAKVKGDVGQLRKKLDAESESRRNQEETVAALEAQIAALSTALEEKAETTWIIEETWHTTNIYGVGEEEVAELKANQAKLQQTIMQMQNMLNGLPPDIKLAESGDQDILEGIDMDLLAAPTTPTVAASAAAAAAAPTY